MSKWQPFELLVLALDAGETLAAAGRAAGLAYVDAIREAKAFGWPDAEAIRQAAEEIRSEHSREESTTMNPRRTEPVPIEDDVAAALVAGAPYVELHTSDPGPSASRSGVTWRAPGVTDEQLAADVPEASTESVDRQVLDGTQALLQLFGELRNDRALDREQRARAVAVHSAAEITKDIGGGPTVADLIDLADYIVTGRVNR